MKPEPVSDQFENKAAYDYVAGPVRRRRRDQRDRR